MRRWLTAGLLVLVTLMGLKIWTLQGAVTPATVAIVGTPIPVTPTSYPVAAHATATWTKIQVYALETELAAEEKTVFAGIRATATPVVRYVPYHQPPPLPTVSDRPRTYPPPFPSPQMPTAVNRAKPSQTPQTLCDSGSGRCYRGGIHVQCPLSFDYPCDY